MYFASPLIIERGEVLYEPLYMSVTFTWCRTGWVAVPRWMQHPQPLVNRFTTSDEASAFLTSEANLELVAKMHRIARAQPMSDMTEPFWNRVHPSNVRQHFVTNQRGLARTAFLLEAQRSIGVDPTPVAPPLPPGKRKERKESASAAAPATDGLSATTPSMVGLLHVIAQRPDRRPCTAEPSLKRMSLPPHTAVTLKMGAERSIIASQPFERLLTNACSLKVLARSMCFRLSRLEIFQHWCTLMSTHTLNFERDGISEAVFRARIESHPKLPVGQCRPCLFSEFRFEEWRARKYLIFKTLRKETQEPSPSLAAAIAKEGSRSNTTLTSLVTMAGDEMSATAHPLFTKAYFDFSAQARPFTCFRFIGFLNACADMWVKWLELDGGVDDGSRGWAVGQVPPGATLLPAEVLRGATAQNMERLSRLAKEVERSGVERMKLLLGHSYDSTAAGMAAFVQPCHILSYQPETAPAPAPGGQASEPAAEPAPSASAPNASGPSAPGLGSSAPAPIAAAMAPLAPAASPAAAAERSAAISLSTMQARGCVAPATASTASTADAAPSGAADADGMSLYSAASRARIDATRAGAGAEAAAADVDDVVLVPQPSCAEKEAEAWSNAIDIDDD